MARSAALTLVFLVVAGAADAGAYRTPRTPSGAPDLEGLWTNATATPLQRPERFKGLTTTEAEAAAYERDFPVAFFASGDPVGARSSDWWELGTRMLRIGGQIRTSVIVDPPDGRFPYTPAGRALMTAQSDAVMTRFEGPEVRPPPERCLAGNSGTTGAPMFTGAYNANYRIVQTARDIAILMEGNDSVRIIRLGAQHGPAAIRVFGGDSVGHWEGETLVVETVGFHPAESLKPPAPLYISADAKVTERFTRLSAGEILYQFTVDDPAIFTRAWRGETLLTATKGPIYEYACHEGNYALPGILAGARHLEHEAGEKRP